MCIYLNDVYKCINNFFYKGWIIFKMFTLFHLFFAHKKKSKGFIFFCVCIYDRSAVSPAALVVFSRILCYLVIKNKTVWNMLQMTLSYLFYFWEIQKSKFSLLESSKPLMHTWTELWHCWTWLLIDLKKVLNLFYFFYYVLFFLLMMNIIIVFPSLFHLLY